MKSLWKFCAAIVLLVAAHILAPLSASAAQPERISVTYCQDCVPFHFTDDEGQPAGLIIDQWRMWSENTGIKINYIAAPWNETLRMVGAGEADAHAGLFYNPQRDEYLDYGAALGKTDTHYFVHRDLPLINRLEDLSAYRVGVLKGDLVEGFLKQKIPEGSVVGFQTYQDIMNALQSGQLQAFASDTLTGLHHLQKSNLADDFEYPGGKPLYQSEWFVAVKQGNADLLKIINDGMGRITDEERGAIVQRWASSSVEQDENVVVISVPRTYPPFALSGFKGEPRGLLVEMWQLWSETTGTPIRFLPSAWQGTIDSVTSGAADIHSGLFKNDERSVLLNFSDPIHEIKTAVYFLTNSNNASKLSEFHKERVGVITGTAQEQFLKDQYGDIELKGYKGVGELISALLNDEIEFIVGETPSIDATLTRQGLQRDVSSGFDELLSNFIHAGVAKGNEELLKKINDGFAAISFEKLAELDKFWMPNPDHRFYRKAVETVELTREEEDWLAVHPFIRLAVTSFISPVDIVDAEGNYSGMNADLMTLLNKKMGTRIVPEIFDKWGDVAKNTLSGNVDGAFSFSRTPEREKHVYFTKPYAYDPIVVIARQGDETVRSWNDLSGKTVSVAKGFSVVEELRRKVGDGELILIDSDDEGLKLLSEGKTDAHVTFQIPYANARKNTQISGLRIVDAKNTESGAFRIAVHKDQPILFSIIQKGVNALTRGELSELQNRWLTPKQASPDIVQELDLSNAEKIWLDDHNTVRVMVGTWPPFQFMAKEEPRGLALDYVRHILESQGLKIEYVPISFKDALEGISKLETVDVLPTIARSAEREKLVTFTQDYLSFPRVIFARKNNAFGSLDELHGKTVAVERGFITASLLKKDHPEINLLEVDTTKGALEAVSFSKADAFVSNMAVGSYLIDNLGLTNLSVSGQTDYKSDIQAMGVRKDWPELASIIDKSLAAMSATQARDIRQPWITLDTSALRQTKRAELSAEERQWLQDHPLIRVGNETDWPPFDFAENGTAKGMSIDIMNTVAKKVGAQVEYTNGYTWVELMAMFKAGELDVLPAIYQSEDRLKYMEFTNSYATNPSVLAIHKKNSALNSLDKLAGKKVGIVAGFVTEELLAKTYPDVNVVSIKNIEDGLYKVSTGEIDATFGSLGVISNIIETKFIPNVRISFNTGLNVDGTTELRMAASQENEILRDILQKGLDAISPEEMRAIRSKWISVEATSGDNAAKAQPLEIVRTQSSRGLWLTVGAAVLIFIGLIVVIKILLRSSKGDAVALQMGSKRFRFMIIGTVLLLALLVCTVSWLTFNHNKNRIIEANGVNLQTVLTNTAERVLIWIEEGKAQVAHSSRDPQFVTLTKALLTLPQDKKPLQFSQALADIRKHIRDQDKTIGSQGFFIITPDGISIGSMRDENLASKNLIAIQKPDLFKQVVGGTAVFIPPIRSDVHLEAGASGPALPPTMFFAAPIVDEYGTVLAVLTNRVAPGSAFTRGVQTGFIGATGETYAFDVSGLMMSSSRFEDDLTERGILEKGQPSILNIVLSPPSANDPTQLTFMAQSAVSGRSGINLDGYENYRGVKTIGTWLWLDQLGLGLATEIDVAEVFEIVDTLKRTILIVLGLTLTLSMGATLFTLSLGERTSASLVRAKEELEGRVLERTEEVQSQRDLIKAVMDSMSVGVAAFNNDLKLIAWNQKYIDIRGYPEEIVFDGAAFKDLVRYDVEQGEFGAGDPELIFAEKMEQAHKFEAHAFDRQRPDGTFIEVLGGPIEGGGFVSTYADITERKRMEVELTVAMVKAEAATQSKAAFLAAMSHEIRTPMNGVVGMISLLQEGHLEPDQRTMMNTVQDSAFSLLQIINDILDFSKIEAGKMTVENIPVNIDTVLEGVTETLLPNIAKKNLRMALFIDPDIPDHVLADQVRLRQILFNLAGNATKFTENTPERRGAITLRAELAEPVKDGHTRIRLSVIDNGIGMNADAVDKLFTPFTQADQSTTRRFGGTGLGLSICKNLTELMGGEVSVESTEGEGSAFHVTLPFDVAEQADHHIRQFDLSGLNIAYAVKFDDTAEAVDRYATAGGARVTRLSANDIVAMVRAQAESDPFDIVILGTLDEELDHEKVIEDLRSHEDGPGTRFVILSPDRTERRGMILPDKVVIASAPVRKSTFMHGVAMAAGRASPEVDNEAPKLSAGARKAPEVEDARAAGELILVAEDNITNQDVIRRQLNVLGYACEVADDGAIALAMLKSCAYGMLLTDCHMPNMDGYELTGALRNLEMDLDKRLPVVAITANALQGEADRCLAAGMDDYLAKPLEMNKLKAMLAKWLPVDHGGDDPVEPKAEDATATEDEAPAADGDAVVNVKALTDMFGDDEEMLKEILGDYIEPSNSIIDEIDAGYEAHDAEAVGKAGHKLKSSSRAIGADALADLCAALEKAGKGGDWDELEKLHPDLHPTFEAVILFIENL